MAKWFYIIVPAGFGWLAFEVMDPAHWKDISRGMILALSLLGATVLVRLARGVPVSNTEYFEVSEMRDLTKAVKQVYRALIVLFAAVIISILGLVFATTVLDAIPTVQVLDPSTAETLQQVFSGALIAAVSFALIRTVALVRGDYDLVTLQARMMERAVERRHAEKHVERMEGAESAKPFERREGYGKLAQ